MSDNPQMRFAAPSSLRRGMSVVLEPSGSVRAAEPHEARVGETVTNARAGSVLVQLDAEPVQMRAGESFDAGAWLYALPDGWVVKARDEAVGQHYALKPSPGPGSLVPVLAFWNFDVM